MFKKKGSSNCGLCQWKIISVREKNEKGSRPLCTAQGSQDCANVYNTRECRKLYLRKHTETIK